MATATKGNATPADRAAGGAVVSGVRISHPDRLIYPELGLSKLHLARYYEGIARWVVPHVRGRPLTLVHCPAGLSGPCSYLKHPKASGFMGVRRIQIQEKAKVGEYLVADSIGAVVTLAQMGVLEIHTWNSTADELERPNRIVWDLDPGPEIVWEQTVAAAHLLRDVLEQLGLAAWVKTTGGRGLHLVVPVRASLGWSDCLEYSRSVAEVLVRSNPALYTVTFAKRGRERKILIDYLRNNRSNTSVCAYSPRARPGALVSLPIAWKELSTPPDRWTLTVPRRLQRLRTDPWAGYWTASQRISKASFKALRGL